MDLQVAHVQMQLRRLEGDASVRTSCARRFAEEKDARIDEVLASAWAQRQPRSRSDAKKLFTSAIYGAVVPHDAGEFLLEFAAEQAQIRARDVAKHPKVFAACKDARDPEASMEYLLNQDEER
eukprot:14468138-Alexandrium_andersonii.AAC.1